MHDSENPRGPEPAGVSAILATAMTTAVLLALAVLGLGMLSFWTDADIIAVPGLGQAPGVVGMIAALVVYAVLALLALRIARPRYRAVWTIAFAVALVHLVVVGCGALFAAGDPVAALAVTGGLITGGASLVVLIAAAAASWIGVALRRTAVRKPQWPWERDDDEI